MVTGTTTSLNGNDNTNSEHNVPLLPSTKYSCTSCQVTFHDGQQQRAHMKDPWHVCNIKRRIESLPPLSLEIFETTPQPEKTSMGRSSPNPNHRKAQPDDTGEEDLSDEGTEQPVSPFSCLFCHHTFTCDDAGFTSNLEHMATEHGLFVQDQEKVNDLQSFIGYLAIEIKEWHECLYCGATKASTFAIQNHMRDKGHCRLNFDREPELLDFWETSPALQRTSIFSGEQPVLGTAPDTEVLLDSGRVIGSRHTGPSQNRLTRQRKSRAASTALRMLPSASDQGTAEQEPPLLGSQPSFSRQLARREEMGIQGISIQQRQALILAEKKAQRSEAVARRAREWVYAKGANLQEFDQLDTKGKWGKQNHKLLPR